MARRAVLSLSRLTESQHVLRLEESLTHLDPGAESQALVDLAGLASPGDPFAQTGAGLFSFLEGQQPVQAQLVASRANGCRLLIEDESPDAQGLPWECLRDAAGNFLALGSSPLFSRTVTPKKQLKPLTRTWQPPLRVLAVLAATGTRPDGPPLTAVQELEALVRGLETNDRIAFELRVLGCDDGLSPDATARTDPKLWIEQNNPHGLLSYGALQSVEQIGHEIDRLKPHVVHFFCHGFASQDSQPRLELALRTDQLAGLERGSLILEAPAIAEQLAAHPDLWLLVLNCCLGAAAGESISLARELMSTPELDLPAVIAMRDAVDRRDAHLFCERFYDAVTDELSTAIAGALPQDLLWVETLPPVRQALCRARCQTLSQADQCREWTLPVLYVRREQFQIVDPGHGLPPRPADAGDPPDPDAAPPDPLDADEILGQLRTLRALREELGLIPDLPAERLAKVDERIAELQERLLEAL